jgi:hypothetical protein
MMAEQFPLINSDQGCVQVYYYGQNTSVIWVSDADRDTAQFYEDDLLDLISKLQQAYAYIQQQKEK